VNGTGKCKSKPQRIRLVGTKLAATVDRWPLIQQRNSEKWGKVHAATPPLKGEGAGVFMPQVPLLEAASRMGVDNSEHYQSKQLSSH
jgi:hypothetical protein